MKRKHPESSVKDQLEMIDTSIQVPSFSDFNFEQFFKAPDELQTSDFVILYNFDLISYHRWRIHTISGRGGMRFSRSRFRTIRQGLCFTRGRYNTYQAAINYGITSLKNLRSISKRKTTQN